MKTYSLLFAILFATQAWAAENAHLPYYCDVISSCPAIKDAYGIKVTPKNEIVSLGTTDAVTLVYGIKKTPGEITSYPTIGTMGLSLATKNCIQTSNTQIPNTEVNLEFREGDPARLSIPGVVDIKCSQNKPM